MHKPERDPPIDSPKRSIRPKRVRKELAVVPESTGSAERPPRQAVVRSAREEVRRGRVLAERRQRFLVAVAVVGQRFNVPRRWGQYRDVLACRRGPAHGSHLDLSCAQRCRCSPLPKAFGTWHETTVIPYRCATPPSDLRSSLTLTLILRPRPASR